MEDEIRGEAHFTVERFFTVQTQTAVWLRKMFDRLRDLDSSAPEAGKELFTTFSTLDIWQEEYGHHYAEYAALVRAKAPAVAALVTPRPLSPAAFQKLLRPDEALIATLVTPLDLYVWTLTPTRVVVSRAAVTEQHLRDVVQALRSSLAPGAGPEKASASPFNAAAAYELYRLIFGPVESTLGSTKHIIWYGHGPLASVPPSVLVEAPSPKAELTVASDFSRTHFLVDRFAFSALADLSLLPWLRLKDEHRTHPKAFLGVGAPLLTADELKSGVQARSTELAGGLEGKALADLAKIPESADELRALASIFGTARSTLWLGPDANGQHFVGDGLRGYQIIALATHGFLPNEVDHNVPEPALLLALDPTRKDRFDGLLTSSQIARLRLDADLVLLSACNTASADARPRPEAFTGLAQAFFTAGARTLMVSHWPVNSGAARELSVATVERAAKQGLPLAESLRRAMIELRKRSSSSDFESHPSYWGPFVIVGDGDQSLAP